MRFAWQTTWRLVLWLRVEEVVALVFILPTSYLTVVAYDYASRVGGGPRFGGGVARVWVALGVLALLALGLRLFPSSPLVRGSREVLPFLTCILIYTNLHDTIGFVNTHDIHWYLAALDRQIFGVIPCVWTQRWITPARTEMMQFFYLNFFWIAPSTSLLLLLRGRWPEFRTTTLGVIVCFYLGYFLYTVFPAAPPRLVLVYEFKRSLQGYPSLLSSLSAQAFELLPVDSRAAFPSLHAAVSTLGLVYAWRFLRVWFWILLPFALGLWTSTIYLRHHFVVDLFAGWLLVPIAAWLAPRIDRWWSKQQRALGIEPARGAA
jgi:membrane-associated phospholipid phosphatase